MNLDTLITKPTLLLDQAKAERNIERMVAKAKRSGVRLRPHFKTHQSATVGEWFRRRGVDAITVSSVEMARYFADHGWDDITIAFSANLRQARAIDALAARVRLGLLVESVETAVFLAGQLTHEVQVWLKIDVGYHRTGMNWADAEEVRAVATAVARTPRLHLAGLLTHAGHTYHAHGQEAVAQIYRDTVARLQQVRSALQAQGHTLLLSVGDTPGCSLLDDFGNVDEIRPGNFIFYDLMQRQIGACTEEEIAVALACPVVARNAARRQIVLYGGAVHLSKEGLEEGNGGVGYGRIARLTDRGWTPTHPGARVISLSQEHGIVQVDRDLFDSVQVGDLLLVLPVHSCLTANLMGRYLTLDGTWIEMGKM